MRSAIQTVTLVLALMLSGCTSTGTITPESVASAIEKGCGIVVTLADIAVLITKDPAVNSVDGFAKMVCDALHQQQAAGAAPKAGTQSGVLNVNGVPVHYTTK